MPLELLTKEELVTAAIATKRPVAFLVGSPLSLKDGVGVPGITEILEFVRAKVRDRVAFALPRFESALAGKTGGDAYQEAMKWLGRNFGQDAINEVIKTAVLEARRQGISEPLEGTDGQPDEWNIPPGTAFLGEMVAGGNERFLGPVLTTNFDPLVSLAVRNAGGRAGRRVLAADGTLAGAAEDEPGICTVVHLHGFWRDSDTLHTQMQLNNPRLKLTKSLQRLLQRRTLIVAAYGGWDDVFTQALVDLMNDEQAPLDVIWCFYESEAAKVKAKHGKLLTAVEPAIVMNRFRAFGGIDCHSIFGEILATLRGMLPPAAIASAVASPLAGWERIDADYLGALPPLRSEEVLRYFDGATPTWRHATCPDIPNRAAVAEIGRRLAEVQTAKMGCSLQLIRAAGGEGKTTALLQATAAAARSGGWNVLWRPTPRAGLPPEHIVKLDPSKQWLIVADDAENLVHNLGESARLLHESGHAHVHFLLAARDTDWRFFDGDQQSWGTLLKQQSDILLRELGNDDANVLVEAWQKYGSDGLRELASLPNTNTQVSALLHAVHESATRDEGSMFGGLLTVRFGADGLRNHVVALLSRLKGANIENSDHTLFDALLYVAACHAVGLPGINEVVLADLVGVSRDWVQSFVVNPLGEEAAAVRSAGHVMTRHSRVAAALLVAAEQDMGVDVAEVWSVIVRQTVRTGLETQMDRYWFSSIVHAGPRLQHQLPPQFPKQRRKEIAVAAAKSAVFHQSTRLDCIVDLGTTYRHADDFAAAVQVFRDNLSDTMSKDDFADTIRGYWFEWGVAEGSLGDGAPHRAVDAWLQGLSLEDHLKTASITYEQAKVSCAGLGVAFGKLAEPRPDCPFALARRAVAFLGRLTKPDSNTLDYFSKYDRNADKIHTPHPNSIEEAIAWLTTAVARAGRELQDPFLKALLKPEQVSFNMLRDFLSLTPSIKPSGMRYFPPTTQAAPADDSKPLQNRRGLEDLIKAGIERVITEAWEAVPDDTAPDERFRTAKRAASTSISRLSPTIRRQVGAHFQTQKWGPLKAHDPKA